MKSLPEKITITCEEQELWEQHLTLPDTTIVDLGCGTAVYSRKLANSCEQCKVIGFEVDQIQHQRNSSDNLPTNLEFRLGGAEDIALADQSVDIVFMFKSLHHVPVDLMPRAFQEINRILKPGGHAWISEPLYMGEYNDLIRLFHDEKEVREKAFTATEQAVNDGLFTLSDEIFFNVPRQFESFDEFDRQVIQATHLELDVSDKLYEEIQHRYDQLSDTDCVLFNSPIRVDLLKRV